jgi:hypothetical protein
VLNILIKLKIKNLINFYFNIYINISFINIFNKGKSKGMAGGKRGNAWVTQGVLWHFGMCERYPPAMRLLRGVTSG